MSDKTLSPNRVLTYAAPLNIERAIHVDDSTAIVTEALARLGLLNLVPPVPAREEMSVSYWVAYCRLLHLPLDSMAWGYSYRQQRYQVGLAWKEGSLLLPRTRELKALIRDFKKTARNDRRASRLSYGIRLRWRTRKNEFLNDLRQLPRRFINSLRVGIRVLKYSAPSYVSMLIEEEMKNLPWNDPIESPETKTVGLRTNSSSLRDKDVLKKDSGRPS